MKKIVVLFIMIFLSNTSIIFADILCPEEDGYMKKIVPMDINGCIYNVEICFKCVLGMYPQTDIRVLSFSKDDQNCDNGLNVEEVNAMIYENIVTSDFLQSLCQDVLFPPCSTGNRHFVNLFYNKCIYKYNYDGYIFYIACQETPDVPTCTEAIKLCWENGQLIVDKYYYNKSGTWDACPPNDEPDDPPLGESTFCFPIHTPCDD